MSGAIRRRIIRWLSPWLVAGGLLAWPAVAWAQQVGHGDYVVVYWSTPSEEDQSRLASAQVRYQIFRHLPMALVRGTLEQVQKVGAGSNIRSVRANSRLDMYLEESGAAVGSSRVWAELGYSGRGVGIAILDSGVNAEHPDLRMGDKVTQNVAVRIGSASGAGAGGLVFVLEDLYDTDLSGHGTHVASTIAGTGRASEGRFVGIARDATIVSVSAGDHLTTFSALGAFDWLLEHRERLGIRVLNNSWGLGGPFDPDAPINVATRLLHDAGLTVVFAAGNSGPEQDTLNSYSVAPWVIGVAATRTDGSLADFSSRGIAGDPLYHPTVAAPGVHITAARDPSSFIGAIVGPTSSEPYMAMSGTSLAAPHVAATAALLLEANPGLTPYDVKSIIVRSADPLFGRGEYEVGAGFVNAAAAVELARR